MTADGAIAATLAVLILVYLVYTLLRPDQF